MAKRKKNPSDPTPRFSEHQTHDLNARLTSLEARVAILEERLDPNGVRAKHVAAVAEELAK